MSTLSASLPVDVLVDSLTYLRTSTLKLNLLTNYLLTVLLSLKFEQLNNRIGNMHKNVKLRANTTLLHCSRKVHWKLNLSIDLLRHRTRLLTSWVSLAKMPEFPVLRLLTDE